jgi:hypothetical protein
VKGTGRPYDADVQERSEVRLTRMEDRYVLALMLIVVTIITTAIGGDHRAGQVILVIVESATLIVILHASKVPPRTIRLIAVLVGLAAVGTMISISLDRQSIGPGVVGALLALAAPIVIVQRIRSHARIDTETIAASLCIYLLAGIFFAYLYRVIDAIDGQFFVQKVGTAAVDFVYFSFVTMTTLGYGDLTPRTSLGRMLAISEALLGQIYLVAVVALLVGNLGRARGASNELVEESSDGSADDPADDGTRS